MDACKVLSGCLLVIESLEYRRFRELSCGLPERGIAYGTEMALQWDVAFEQKGKSFRTWPHALYMVKKKRGNAAAQADRKCWTREALLWV